MKASLVLLPLAALVAAAVPARSQTEPTSPVPAKSEYKLAATIDLPGDKGGHGDWTTFDPDTRTVWLSQSPDHNVVVIDAATRKVAGVISGIENGNGIALTPEYAFLSDNKAEATVIVEKRGFKRVGQVQAVGKGRTGPPTSRAPPPCMSAPIATT